MDENSVEYKIGQRIRAARLNKNMSQENLAFEAHVSLPHISDIELGKKEMRLTTFIRIIEALQISADEILRPNVPEVNRICEGEFSELLSDCSPTEIESIVRIARELKSTLREKKDKYDF